MSAPAVNGRPVSIDVTRSVEKRPAFCCHLRGDGRVSRRFRIPQTVLNLDEQPAVLAVRSHMDGRVLGIGAARDELVRVGLYACCGVRRDAVVVDRARQRDFDLTDGEGVVDRVREVRYAIVAKTVVTTSSTAQRLKVSAFVFVRMTKTSLLNMKCIWEPFGVTPASCPRLRRGEFRFSFCVF